MTITPSTNEPKPRRTYTKEFKQEAVRLAAQIGNRRAATDLGVDITSIRDWIRAAKTDGEDAFRGHGHAKALEAELARLRRENVILRQEREILKKATEFFSREQR